MAVRQDQSTEDGITHTQRAVQKHPEAAKNIRKRAGGELSKYLGRVLKDVE